MRDTSAFLQQIEQYEENLQVACLAPRTGRVVPLRCDAFATLYDSLAAQAGFEAISRSLVQSHWAAHAIIERLGAAGARGTELQDLARLRGDIHGQLRALRRSLARRADRPAYICPEWLRSILFRPLR